MRIPTEFELQQLQHRVADYDPVRAHEYYLRTRQLRGRRRGQSADSNGRPPGRGATGRDPRTGRTMAEIHRDARAKQRKELAARIQSLESKLQRLEAKIREREHEEASEDRKSKAKRERAAKEKDKPKTAAEKAEAARESKKYRDTHRQELKTKEKATSGKAGGGSSSNKKSGSETKSVSSLKTMVTKVKGQIAVAKQKLAAL